MEAPQEPLKYLENELCFKLLLVKFPEDFNNEYFATHKIGAKTIIVAKDFPWDEIIWGHDLIQIKQNLIQIQNPTSYKFYKIKD